MSDGNKSKGSGEVNMDITVRDGAWGGTYAEWCRRKHIIQKPGETGDVIPMRGRK